MGTPVALTGLIARPWENEFNGQKRHGIAFRAVAVTSLAGLEALTGGLIMPRLVGLVLVVVRAAGPAVAAPRLVLARPSASPGHAGPYRDHLPVRHGRLRA